MTIALAVLAFVTVQRLGELWIARRNTARLLARGATEHAPGHYPAIVVLHALWLIGIWYAAWTQPIVANLALLAVFFVLQALRIWVLTTLGERWTTRIITVPGEARVRSGPFRFFNHPNYMIVCAEIAVLPVAFGLYWFAIAFSIANAILLVIRIRHEEAALSDAEKTRKGGEPVMRARNP